MRSVRIKAKNIRLGDSIAKSKAAIVGVLKDKNGPVAAVSFTHKGNHGLDPESFVVVNRPQRNFNHNQA
jgi:hypothetical protein